MVGAISEKFRTFDMQINCAIPPIFHFHRWLREFFSLFLKSRNFYHSINQLVKEVENFLDLSRQPLISIDTKKEPIGIFKRGGKVLARDQPKSFDHNFVTLSDGQIVPHGIYNVTKNVESMTIGTSHDTSVLFKIQPHRT